MDIKIQCTEKEAQLISRALDLYTRVGLTQFWYLTDCTSLQKLIWDTDDNSLLEKFNQKAIELSNLCTGYTGQGSPGIFNKIMVGDDVRIAGHIHQQIRHEFWKIDGKKEEYTNQTFRADICNIAKIEEPKFEIKIEQKEISKKQWNNHLKKVGINVDGTPRKPYFGSDNTEGRHVM